MYDTKRNLILKIWRKTNQSANSVSKFFQIWFDGEVKVEVNMKKIVTTEI